MCEPGEHDALAVEHSGQEEYPTASQDQVGGHSCQNKKWFFQTSSLKSSCGCIWLSILNSISF